jgi:hypothetical protein
MALIDRLRADWESELAKSSGSALVKSPAFREALLQKEGRREAVDLILVGDSGAALGERPTARAVHGSPRAAHAPCPVRDGGNGGSHESNPALRPGWHLVGPPFPSTVLSPAQARGRRYERAVGKLLFSLCSPLGWAVRDHEWLLTPSGAWLQPDLFLEAPGGGAILLEVKLSYTPDAWIQLACYRRVIHELTGVHAMIAVVCKHLRPGASHVVGEFEDLEEGCVWHAPMI